MTTAEPPRPGPGDDDIDAEFARLMEGVDLDAELARENERPASPPGAEQGSAPDQLTVEDIMGAAQGEEPAIAVVATSVISARALAGAIRLGQEARTDGLLIPSSARVHETSMGAIALGELQEGEAHELAAITSTALQRNGVVLFWRRGDRMTATRYREGERGDDVSPAIVMGAMDDAVEQLMLGAVTADELGEGLSPAAISRDQALEWIADGRRPR